MRSWNSITLGEVLPFKYGKNLPASKRTHSGEYDVVSSAGIIDSHDTAFTTEPCIVIGRKGSIGSLTYCPDPVWPTDTTFYVTGTPYCDLRFGYYVLQTLPLNQMNNDSAVPGLNRNDAESLAFSLPPVSEQKTIAKVLGSLDDKIAVNNKIIELALKIAKLLPQCVQQEQQKYKLSEISNLISRGITPKYVEDGFTVLNQKCIRNNLVDLNQARQASNLPKNYERILQQYDVLVNSTGYGTLGRISLWLHETAQLKTVITDTHITTIRFDDQKVDPAFAAMVLSAQENAVANLAEGSTGQTELKRELIENFEIMLPPFAIQHEVSQQIRPLLLAVMTLRDENQTLARTRDELLPLLMSGKITVQDAEEASAEVGVDKHEVEE